MRFSFIGELVFNTNPDAKVQAVQNYDDKGYRINASVVVSKNNRCFVELFGWKNDPIQTIDSDGNSIEIAWEDRFDENIIKSVAWGRRNVISFYKEKETDEGETEIVQVRHEFITTYDFCRFIKDNMDIFKDKRFSIVGDAVKSWYQGKPRTSFQISGLYELNQDDNRKNSLNLNTIFYWTKDSIDTADFKEEKKIYINGYVYEYVNKKDLGTEKGEKRYLAQQLVLDCSRIDFENEKHMQQLQFRLMNLGLVYKDGKIINNLKSKKYYSNEIVLSYTNGAQDMGDAEEITYDMLTDIQKLKVDLGLAKPADFAAKGRVYGDRVIAFLIKDFPLTGDYANGMVTLETSASEFEDLIFAPTSSELKGMPEPVEDDELPFKDVEEEKPKSKKEKTTKKTKKPDTEPEPEEDDEPETEAEEEEDDDFEDLFG